MILSYCQECQYHGQVEIANETHSRCLKENCLSMYAKCFAEEAIRQFIQKNVYTEQGPANSALEVG